MQRSKNTAVAFLLGAVLVGGALGFPTDRMLVRDHLRAAQPRQTLADRLHLNETQRAVVGSILDDRNRQMALVTTPFREQLDSIKLAARDQIRRLLDEQQRQEFEKLLAEMNEPPKRREQD